MMSESLLDQRLEIETPERVVIVHDLAGIGSRFSAGMIDVACLLIPWSLAFCGVLIVSPAPVDDRGEWKAEETQAVVFAAIGVCYAILWLYFLLFETLWSGQTPGKRALRLRVVSVHGGPATAGAVILRNVLRVVDSLPTGIPPFLGGVSMFVSARAQRLGDLAAGTVVVRERRESFRVPMTRDAADGASEEFSAADLEEVDRFLERRHEMIASNRRRHAARIASDLRERYTLPVPDPVATRGLWSPDESLLGLIGARRTPRELRDLAAPSAERPAPPLRSDVP